MTLINHTARRGFAVNFLTSLQGIGAEFIPQKELIAYEAAFNIFFLATWMD